MKINIPTNCPCCDSPLEMVNMQLFCRNKACPAQLNGKVVHFAKTLGIKGLGEKTVEKLNLSDIPELYYLDEADLTPLVGEKVATKLIQEIEKSKTATLDQILAAFSIPLIGKTAAEKITSIISDIDEINTETCKEAGLGEKATQNLIYWLDTEFTEIRQFLPFSFKVSSNTKTSTGDIICITGKLSSLKTKSEAYKILQDLGFKISESVTKTTKYLVDEEGKGSTKRKKAEELNITIIDNLSNFIKEKSKND
jgi:DNA ligase (NAD+)